ncbi:DUF7554 family protein [Natrinema halophilum]|uniref:Uncharacterized protein n=1 Tax=Natrinema halophilum TaxID=1699371 RepID=A0A7D5GP57_9EURY|nr:hypothetical protein [Natrinema halophilum]QLG50053.1 hypothetical protein HYG82_14910 [Natrinema halophilum]
MRDNSGELEVELLLKLVLGLIAVLLVLEILEAILGSIATLVGLYTPLLQLAIAVLIVLWLLDRI